MCYLNTGDGQFSDISAITDFDYPSDSRGQAFTDWDGDGDLDLWQANRNAPRLRFLLNQTPQNERSLQIRLVGQTCNRDAIGARVRIQLASGKRLLRTLRAGEGYLSQSSKVLIIGLAENDTIISVTVLWPGGTEDTFSDIHPGDKLVLTQGLSLQRSLTAPRVVTASPAVAAAAPPLSTRLIPHRKLALPSLPYTTSQGESQDAALAKHTTLVLLWASWCQPCLHEIQQLTSSLKALKKADVHVLLVNTDDPAQWANEAPTSFQQGHASAAFLDAYDVLQRSIPARARVPALPSSFLVSNASELLALYLGPINVNTVIKDAHLRAVDDRIYRDRAVPFKGRWLIQSLPADLVAIPNRLLELGQPAAAIDYLDRHASRESVKMEPELTCRAYVHASNQFVQANDLQSAKHALIRALQYQPRHFQARVSLAQIHETLGEITQAITQYREILLLDPNHFPSMNSLAWHLATAADATKRNPAEAEQLALRLCQSIDFSASEPLDSLAAAQAAAGKFSEAIATASRGLQLATDAQQSGVAQRIRERLTLYRAGKPYIQPVR